MKYKIEDEGMRLDKYLTNTLEESRSQILKMIKNKEITLNNKYPKAGEILKKNDIIEINHKKEEKEIKSEDLNLEIVYEDDDVIVVNKPNGMVVHPAPGNYSGTLVNGLMYHTKLSDINGELRPGIVHRIDAYTTGLLMVAKNNKAHQILADELAKKETHRKYIALVWGVIPNDTGTINAPIGRNPNDRKKMAIMPNGKKAITHFKVIKRYI